jgi:hypothetical protein
MTDNRQNGKKANVQEHAAVDKTYWEKLGGKEKQVWSLEVI